MRISMRTNLSKIFGDALGRVLSKEGTSEGAERGWETRRGAAPAGEKPVELMTGEEISQEFKKRGITSEPTMYPPSSEKKRFGAAGAAGASPEAVAQWKAEQKAYADYTKRQKQRTALSNQFWEAIGAAAKEGKPISVEAMEWRFPNEKPEGYVRNSLSGEDRYTFYPSLIRKP